MNYTLIANPRAGRGAAEKILPALRSKLQEVLGQGTVCYTRYRGHARELAANIHNPDCLVVVAGGDGTVHEAVNGLAGKKCCMAVLPIGSGNDFVKMLNIPPDYQKAIEIIRADRRMRIDLGKANQFYFANGLGMGFDAQVVQEVESMPLLRGFLLYLIGVLKTLRKYSNRKIHLQWDDGEREAREIFLLAVGNGKAMGGGFYLTPEAALDDGWLDVCLIRGLTKLEALRHLPRALKGTLGSLPQVAMRRVKRLSVHAPGGIPVHADGELIGMAEEQLEISVQPAALEVIHNLPDR